jgi:hypothetical protein
MFCSGLVEMGAGGAGAGAGAAAEGAAASAEEKGMLKKCHCNRLYHPSFFPPTRKNFLLCCSLQQHTMIAMMVRRKELKCSSRRRRSEGGSGDSSGSGDSEEVCRTNLQDISPYLILRVFSFLPIFKSNKHWHSINTSWMFRSDACPIPHDDVPPAMKTLVDEMNNGGDLASQHPLQKRVRSVWCFVERKHIFLLLSRFFFSLSHTSV